MNKTRFDILCKVKLSKDPLFYNNAHNSQRDAKSESRDARCLQKQAAVLKYPSIDFTAGSDHRIENVV